jgi:hypothetical protein
VAPKASICVHSAAGRPVCQHHDARVRQALRERLHLDRVAESAEIQQHDGRRMHRRDGLDLWQRDIACRELEVRIVSDHGLEALGDEVLEPARDYRRHEGDSG